MTRTVYLVGSVPMASAEDVFRRVGGRLGPYVEWLPDGETGERLDWITWLEPIFRDDPALMPSGKMFRVHAGADAHVRYALRPGKKPWDVAFANLFYADKAIQSRTQRWSNDAETQLTVVGELQFATWSATAMLVCGFLLLSPTSASAPSPPNLRRRHA